MGNGASRSDVVRALKAHKVSVFLENETTQLYALERGDFLEKRVLPEFTPMWILNRFKRLLDIPIRHFWKPEEAEAAERAKTESDCD
jgi:hypothetical protein